jgi:hypothetical protein
LPTGLPNQLPTLLLLSPSRSLRIQKVRYLETILTLAYTPKKITDIGDLVQKCFKTSGVCYLFLDQDEMHSKTFAAVNKHFNTKQKLRMFSTALLDEAMFGTDGFPSVIALNGAKGWYKKYDGNVVEADIIAWVDSVKMGEGKKIFVSDEVKKILGLSKDESKEEPKTVTEEKIKMVFEEESSKHDEL